MGGVVIYRPEPDPRDLEIAALREANAAQAAELLLLKGRPDPPCPDFAALRDARDTQSKKPEFRPAGCLAYVGALSLVFGIVSACDGDSIFNGYMLSGLGCVCACLAGDVARMVTR